MQAPSAPKVLNRHWFTRDPAGSVYVGRPSKWGNPFVIGQDGDRAEVIAKYRDYVRASPELMDALSELRGRDLVCWCAPQRCHAEVLLELANNPQKRRRRQAGSG